MTGMLEATKEPARQPERVEATSRRQLAKMGDTSFACAGVDLAWDQPYFLPVASLNALRRDTLERLLEERSANRPLMQGGIVANSIPYPETTLTYRGNILNHKAEAFYRRHGVAEIEPAPESGLDMKGRVVMRTRYCLKHQLGMCDGVPQPSNLREPLALVGEDDHRYPLRFDCAACEMEVLY
jgi:putative protease